MTQPRIITGTAKGTRLKVPDSARPITDRIRTSIFDLLRGEVQDAKVLDLFAGSGAMALEALSRGANSAVMVEMNTQSADIIRQNIKTTNFSTKSTVLNSSSSSYIRTAITQDLKFDLIFMDPPFADLKSFTLEGLNQILAQDGVIVIRKPSGTIITSQTKDLELVHTEKYGSSEVDFLR